MSHDDVIKWKHFPRYWPVPGEFPSQRPVTRSFDVFFDLCLNKQVSKRSWGWWSETPPSSLWRQRSEVGVTSSDNWRIWQVFVWNIIATWALAAWPFSQKFVQVNNKEIIKVPYLLALRKGNHPWPVVFFNNGSMTREAFKVIISKISLCV